MKFLPFQNASRRVGFSIQGPLRRLRRTSFTALLGGIALLGGTGSAWAQWVSESVSLKAGWNAVYLHVDASHITLGDLVGADLSSPIQEVWLWAPPASTLQFVQSPQEPIDNGSQWRSWNRASGQGTLQRLVGNAAYLVRVANSAPTYTWTVKGKPLAPAYEWTTTGLNFLGFPTRPGSAPTFESFLAQAPALQLNAEIYQYNGGELSSSNPARLYAFRTVKVNRGQAYWIRSGTAFNRYFAPFETALTGTSGLSFGDTLNASSFRLRNLTSSNLTVTLNLAASETPPPGQTAIADVPPLLLRGALNTTNLTYAFTNLAVGVPQTWQLAPQGQAGSDVEVVLGLNRGAMSGAEGTLFAGVLHLTDSLGFAQIDLPVSAQAASSAGLWVGEATVKQVGQYLGSYLRDASGNLVADSQGQYQRQDLNTNQAGVVRSFPLRLIVHNPSNGPAVLLQQVFCGLGSSTNAVVATQQGALNQAFLSQARRISASHLPWTPTNQFWSFDGRFGDTTNLSVTVTLPYDDQASNPFLHTYHPDHDNLDATFKTKLPQGMESYTVRREITLTVQPPAADFSSLAANRQVLSGDYAETLSLIGLARAGGTNDVRQFHTQGSFTLTRISPVSQLTTP